MMQLIEDDAEVNPVIPEPLASYIRALPDAPENYARFFDALLIPRPSHAAFFRDLRGFRRLPTTIEALRLCDPNNTSITKEQRKVHYRDVTIRFLGSRFAHPWCRQAMIGSSNSKVKGWWGAEWTATGRRMSREQQEQEDKLHRLLLPLWISFRAKMFPSEETLERWWASEQLNPSTTKAASPVGSTRNSFESERSETTMGTGRNEKPIKSPHSLQDGFDSEDDDRAEVPQSRDVTSAATGLLRLAAAGMLIDSMPKMQKWRLKRELKRHKQ